MADSVFRSCVRYAQALKGRHLPHPPKNPLVWFGALFAFVAALRPPRLESVFLRGFLAGVSCRLNFDLEAY